MSLPRARAVRAIPPADDPESMVIVGASDGSILIVRPPCVLDRGHPGLHLAGRLRGRRKATCDPDRLLQIMVRRKSDGWIRVPGGVLARRRREGVVSLDPLGNHLAEDL